MQFNVLLLPECYRRLSAERRGKPLSPPRLHGQPRTRPSIFSTRAGSATQLRHPSEASHKTLRCTCMSVRLIAEAFSSRVSCWTCSARSCSSFGRAVCCLRILCRFFKLFERSEFLIATCKKKKTDRVCGCLCGCTANLGFSVYVRMFLGFSVEKLSWF